MKRIKKNKKYYLSHEKDRNLGINNSYLDLEYMDYNNNPQRNINNIKKRIKTKYKTPYKLPYSIKYTNKTLPKKTLPKKTSPKKTLPKKTLPKKTATKYSEMVKIGDKQYSKRIKSNLTGYMFTQHWLNDLGLNNYIEEFHKKGLLDTFQLYNNFRSELYFSIFVKDLKGITSKEIKILTDAFKKIIYNTTFFNKFKYKSIEKNKVISIDEWFRKIKMPYMIAKKDKMFSLLDKTTKIETNLDFITHFKTKDSLRQYINIVNLYYKELLSIKEIDLLENAYNDLQKILNELLNSKFIIKDNWSKEKITIWIKSNINYKDQIGPHQLLNDASKKKLIDFIYKFKKTITYDEISDMLKQANVKPAQKKRILRLLYPNKGIHLLNDMYEELEYIALKYKDDYKKYRVFYIGGHGVSCPLYNFRDAEMESKYRKDRLRYDKVPSNINIKNLVIYTTQSFGRLSLANLHELFITHPSLQSLRNMDNKNIYKILYNVNNIKDFNKLDSYITLKHFYNDNYYQFNRELAGSSNSYDNFIYNYKYYKSHGVLSKYPASSKTKTTKNIVNLMKYHEKNPPPNFKISWYSEFNILSGIIELTGNSQNDLNYLYNKVKTTAEISNYKQFGLDELKNTKNYENINRVLKYNKELYKLFMLQAQEMRYNSEAGKYYTLEDIINIISKVGNIKKDEKILIISNYCRGIDIQRDNSDNKFNNINSMAGQDRENAEVIRETSRTRMHDRL